jgi:transposase
MRQLAMRFRGLLRGTDTGKLNLWLDDAEAAGIYAMQSFARTIRRDITAVKNAITEVGATAKPKGRSTG